MTYHFIEVRSDGEITLPAEVLEDMGLEEGDRLYLVPHPDGFALIPAKDRELLNKEMPIEQSDSQDTDYAK